MFINLFVNTKKAELKLGPTIAWRVPADSEHLMVDN